MVKYTKNNMGPVYPYNVVQVLTEDSKTYTVKLINGLTPRVIKNSNQEVLRLTPLKDLNEYTENLETIRKRIIDFESGEINAAPGFFRDKLRLQEPFSKGESEYAVDRFIDVTNITKVPLNKGKINEVVSKASQQINEHNWRDEASGKSVSAPIEYCDNVLEIISQAKKKLIEGKWRNSQFSDSVQSLLTNLKQHQVNLINSLENGLDIKGPNLGIEEEIFEEIIRIFISEIPSLSQNLANLLHNNPGVGMVIILSFSGFLLNFSYMSHFNDSMKDFIHVTDHILVVLKNKSVKIVAVIEPHLASVQEIAKNTTKKAQSITLKGCRNVEQIIERNTQDVPSFSSMINDLYIGFMRAPLKWCCLFVGSTITLGGVGYLIARLVNRGSSPAPIQIPAAPPVSVPTVPTEPSLSSKDVVELIKEYMKSQEFMKNVAAGASAGAAAVAAYFVASAPVKIAIELLKILSKI